MMMLLSLTLLIVSVFAWLGWVARQAWIYPRLLQKAECLCAANCQAEEVLKITRRAPLANGEVGFRLHLLAAKSWLALDNRHMALEESRRAHLARMSFPMRWMVKLFLKWERALAPGRQKQFSKALLRLAPESGWLQYYFSFGQVSLAPHEARTWEDLLMLLPKVQDDPLILESLLEAALKRLRDAYEHPSLGPQEWSPMVPFLFDETMKYLLEKHGLASNAWDRTPPAVFLLGQKRFGDVLALVRTIPPTLRSASLCEAEVIALRRSGDMKSAELALERSIWDHPASFRLWMERFHSAMATQRFDMGLESLEMARSIFPDPVPDFLAERLSEWTLNRAEYALWIEQDPEKAMELVEEIPEPARSSNPHLLMQGALALGRYEEALKHAERFLARHSGNVDVLLVQAECMAGMEAWEALEPFLDQMPEAAKIKPSFWHLKGLCLSHKKDYTNAREHLERAAQMEAGNLRYVLDAGHACMDTGEHYRSEQHWRQALRLSPTNEESLVHLALTRRSLQDAEGARRLVRECLLHHPDSRAAQGLLMELEAH